MQGGTLARKPTCALSSRSKPVCVYARVLNVHVRVPDARACVPPAPPLTSRTACSLLGPLRAPVVIWTQARRVALASNYPFRFVLLRLT